jgi:alpha-L-fucosidase
MTRTHAARFLLSFCCLLLAACSGTKTAQTSTSDPAAPHAASANAAGKDAAKSEQDGRMAWWRDARFGMFIHWGLYSIPAGTWPEGDPNARHDHAEWIRETAHIPVAEYEKLQPRFNPVKFDPDLWARMAADAGMKYLVITSKHHDGFDLFDSKWSDWDVGGTPFKRDILKELSEACARHGVRFCTYHSIMDWHHPDYLPRRTWEKASRPEGNADYAKFEEYLHHQVEEVVTRYHPGVMWFDGEWEATWNHERGLRLFELCRKLDPTMIVNNRVDVNRGGMGGFSTSKEAVGDFATPEQEIPATGVPGLDWETCMTMNDHWGFNAADTNWKTTEDLVRKLADIASKGGNFLLNIGPRSDGTFPPEAVERLAQIGAWMNVNGDSIHGTTASPFDALAFGRCTVKAPSEKAGSGKTPTRLYLHVFEWPKDRRLVLPGLGNEIGRAYLLATPTQALTCKRQDSDVWIAVPESAPDAIDSVVALEIQGAPIVYKAPKIEAASDIFVKPLEVKLVSSAKELEIHYTTDGSEPTAASTLYRAPILVETTSTIRARSFRGGAAVSGVQSAQFEKVVPLPGHERKPKPNGKLAPLEEWVNCDVYFGDWDKLPDFEATGPSVAPTDRAQRVDLDFLKGGLWLPNKSMEHLALRYWGFLDVQESDVYVFELSSDDGSKLWIDGKVVVDNDGLHSTEAKRGRVALEKGIHDVTVGWFNKSGGAELKLSSGRLGAALEPTKLFSEHEDGLRR